VLFEERGDATAHEGLDLASRAGALCKLAARHDRLELVVELAEGTAQRRDLLVESGDRRVQARLGRARAIGPRARLLKLSAQLGR
jgi:hypothetical protein